MVDAVGKRIRLAREARGRSVSVLAVFAGVPAGTIIAVEQGTRQGARLSLKTLKKLARTLGVTLDHLGGLHEE